MTDITAETKSILANTLQLGQQIDKFDESTELLGSLPELDSMAVVSLITALEEHFEFIVDDEEITAEIFETIGSLTDFIAVKLRKSALTPALPPGKGGLKNY